jgi:cytochrome c-type biogenesis protein CcmH
MMGWVMVIALAAATFALLVSAFRLPRGSWEIAGAALLAGLAGFAWQAQPGLPGSPRQAAEQAQAPGKELVAARKALADKGLQSSDRLAMAADAFSRNGQFAEAAGILRGVVAKEPGNGDAWLALANNLMAHSEGSLTPAAQFAYRRAAAADPANPGPPYFLGLALAQSGDLAGGRALWAGLLKQTPPNAPWRAELEQRLAELDAFIARQNAGSGH